MAEALTIARPYAVAAFRLARERNTLSEWSDILGFLSAVVADSSIQYLINDPKITTTNLQHIFLRICEGRLSDSAVNLVKVLSEYGRLAILPDIANAFEILKAEDDGVLQAKITAATQLSDSDVAILVKKLEARFNKKIEANVDVNPEIIGGIKILVGDTVIDASVKGQLQQMAYSLKS